MEFKDFTGLYPLSKTLRFELKPVGRTLEFIISGGLLNQDKQRAESYIKVKKIIDEYHKAFIESVLEKLKEPSEGKKDSLEDLEEFYTCYMCKSKNESHQDNLTKLQDNLRKEIADSFAEDDRFKRIDKEELIKEDLDKFVTTQEDRSLIDEFKNFTTYFTGFHKNRKNMYSAEAQTTAIAYRLINENLPRFIDNIHVFDKVVESPVSEHFAELYANFEGDLNVVEIPEIFRLDYYKVVLTQKQIDVYNYIIGGKTLEDGTKIKGLNEYINLYNQQQNDKSARLPKFKPLFKQILSDKNAIPWLSEQFHSDEEVLEVIEKAYQQLNEQVLDRNSVGEHSLKELLLGFADYDLSKIYIRNDSQMTDISQKVFGHWGLILKALMADLKMRYQRNPKKETDEVYEKRLNKILKSQGSISVDIINKSVNRLNGNEQNTIEGYFVTLGAVKTDTEQKEDLFTQIENAYAEVKDLLNTPYRGKNLSQDKVNVEKIKNLLDTIKALQHFVKPLLGDGTESEKDEKFYGEFTALWEELDKITPLYNMVRNYLTRKPYSTEKIKLNFENSQLLGGWDENKEKDYLSVILRKENKYYLGIINKNHKKILKEDVIPNDGDCYEKMVYKAIATPTGVGGFIRKCYDVTQKYGWNCPASCLNAEGKIIIKDEEAKDNLVDIINCQKDFFDKYEKDGYKYKNFNFKFRNSEDYEKLSEFYNDVKHQAYKITFRNVSVSYIDKLVEEGKLYLFQIYNKDFSEYSKGTPNLHTLYWKMLFDERNLADVVYKLNGQAEVFFRKSSISYERPTHPANQSIENKNTLNKKKHSIFTYDLIKNKRYTVDKFQFHVPITINFKSTGKDNINRDVLEFLKYSDDTHIIGIDRGERNLLYLVVIDKFGNIKEQMSLNEICNKHENNVYKTNYHDLLETREKERLQARQSWQEIENIKDLKEGYLSQVIHKIAQLMIKYNAIVALEYLNKGFMRGRQKVEKQVYQKFEKMLIDKLNYLVDKQADSMSIGGVLKAYQLTNKFESFTKLGTQSGFLFYVPAWNTSKIDPATGFVNLLSIKYENIEQARSFFYKFDNIRYNSEKDWFEFDLDYNKFGDRANGTRTNWTICTRGTRIESFRNIDKNSQWDWREVDLTKELKSLFEKNGIDITTDLKGSIA